jgi:hypothetical protein
MGWRHEDGGPRRTAVVPGGLASTPTAGGVQSVVFPAPGFGWDVQVCTFLALTRVEVVAP